MWSRLGQWLGRRTLATMAGVLIVTALLAIGLGKLGFATGQDSYLDPASQVARDNERYQTLFGGENMVVLFTAPEGKTVADLFTAGNIASFAGMETDLAGSPAIQAVITPVSLLQWTQDIVTKGVAVNILNRTREREPDSAAQKLRDADSALTLARLGAAGAQSFDNPEWVKFLLFGNDGFTAAGDGSITAPAVDQLKIRRSLRAFIPDSRHAILAAVLTGNASLDVLSQGSSAVKAALAKHQFENASVIATGTPTFLTDINDYLQGGMMVLGGIAVLVMMVILIVAFKVRWRLLPLLGMAIGVAWGFGLFGFTGTKLSLVTIAGLPILIGLGIEFAIQIQNRIEEEHWLDHERNPFAETMRHMGPPLLSATIAASIAFLVVKISKVPMVQDFGVLLTLGIVALLVAGLVVPTALIGARERRSPSTKAPTVSWVERTVQTLGRLPKATVLPLVVLAVGIPVLGVALEGGTRIESDPINWANPSSESVRNVRVLEHETGFASTLGVFIETGVDPTATLPSDASAVPNGVFTDQMGAFVFDLVERSLADNPELAEASSLATTVGWLTEVPGTTTLAPTGLDMLEAYRVAPKVIQESLVGQSGGAAQVLFQVGPSSLERRSVVLDNVQAAIARPAQGAAPLPLRSSATTGGLAVVGVGLLDNITANRAELTIVAVLLVAAFVILRYRSLVRGLLTMIPVLLAVGTSAVLVRVLDITLSPLTTVGGPLVVATCAEFSILLVDRYFEERRRGLTPEDSNRVAAERTGRAFFVSALTTLGGFAVLMFSTLPLLADFGMVVTINIAVALLAALVVVPPLLTAADHRGLLRAGDTAAAWSGGIDRRHLPALAGGVIAAVIGGVMVSRAVEHRGPVAEAVTHTSAVEAPATIPTTTTSTTSTTTTTTTIPTTTPVLAPGETAAPTTSSTTTTTTLPPGPAERPAGLVAGAFYDALITKGGVTPGVARCATDDLIATTPEADLLAMGIASTPRPEPVNELLRQAGFHCGITQAQLDAAAG